MSLSQTAVVPMRNVRWKIFLLLLTLVAINYVDRTALSVSMPLISKEFHLDAETKGFIFSAFFWPYFCMQIPSGLLVDRFKPRAILSITAVSWGFLQAVVMVTAGWISLALTRMCLGLAEGPIYPAASKLTALWLTRNERTRGTTLIGSGASLGSAFGAVLIVSLITWLGSWRLAFLISGLGTIVCGLFAWYFIRDQPADHPLIGPDEVTHIEGAHAREDADDVTDKRAAIIHFMRYPSVWAMCISLSCSNIVWYGLITWLPTYLFAVHHFDMKSLGNATFLIFLCGFIGELAAGQIADHWKIRGGRPNTVYRTMMGTGAFLVGLSFFLVAYVVQPMAVVALLCIAVFFLRWTSGCTWTVPALLARRERTGTLASIMNFIGNTPGLFVPILIGLIVQHTGSYFLALMFFVATALVLFIAVLMINYQRRLPV
jgi:ACS family D-galactonate transporter-like MFS transporter